MQDTLPLLRRTDFPSLRRHAMTTLQVNITYTCNLACFHCHVASSPKRTERLSDDDVELLIQVLRTRPIDTLDLTGGAPEMHPRFAEVVSAARAENIKVIDRCNLTILSEPGYEHLAQFLADHQVQIVASLPCYTEENVDSQRGRGVFEISIEALQRLNSLGYGQPESGLFLHLVYNPTGPTLPPPQAQLHADYTRELFEKHGIVFNELFTITNMPIKRFGSMLVTKGEFETYMKLLRDSYNQDNLDAVMCRSTLSVDYQGYLYDCDFNQQLGIPLPPTQSAARPHLRDLLTTDYADHPISVADHCYGCTAGAGSSCGGALS